MNGVVFVLDLTVVTLAIPACLYAWGYAFQAGRQARQARQDASEAYRLSRVMLFNTERTQHLMRAAQVRYCEAAQLDVAAALAAPLEQLVPDDRRS